MTARMTIAATATKHNKIKNYNFINLMSDNFEPQYGDPQQVLLHLKFKKEEVFFLIFPLVVRFTINYIMYCGSGNTVPD